MIRAALYARVSTSNGHQTTANQLDALAQVAERQNWLVTATFTDELSGAKGRHQRPGYDAMLRAVTRREVDLVAAWSVDRLGRSLQDLVHFLEELKASGVDLYLHQQGLDTRTPAGRALFGMLAVFSEFERALIVERVKAGMVRAAKHGTRSGKPIGRPRTSPRKLAAAEADIRAGLSMRAVARLHRIRPETAAQVRDRLRAE
jgi:DNA invertase Pin-like site-specific DNA recombinase